jgi:hypothetical protein
MAAPRDPHEDHLEAARVAVAMLRFQEPLAHLQASSTPEGMPVIGVDAYVFLPSPQPILRPQLAEYLTTLSCPAFLAPTTARGFISVSLLDDLSADRRRAMKHHLSNQVSGLTEMAPGADADRVLLEFDDEVHLFSLGAVRRWAGFYPVFVGWSIWPSSDRSRAEWQMNLFGGDGKRYSKGVGPAFQE